jgi:adhesin/invasin
MKRKTIEHGAFSIMMLLAVSLVAFASPALTQTNVSIDDAIVYVDEVVTRSIMINNVTDPAGVGTADIKLSFDSNVVHVTAFTAGDFDSIVPNLEHNESGADSYVTFMAYQVYNSGLTGDVLVATVTLKAVGTAGLDSPLNITITMLANKTALQGNVIPADDVDGTFAINMATDQAGPVINQILFNSAASLTVTAGANVNVSVTVSNSDGWENISTVVVDMSAFGVVPAVVELTRMANDTKWAVFNKTIQVTKATADTATANASDKAGNWSGDFTSGILTVDPAAPSKLAIFGPTSATVGHDVELTIQSQDQYGNNESTAGNVVYPTASGSGSVAESSVTLVAGTATTTVIDDTAETTTVTANCAGGALDSATYDVEFMPVITGIEVTSADASIPADTIGNTTITAQLMAGTTPLLKPGVTVTFDVNATMATVNPTSNVTGADGKAYTTLTATDVVGTVTVIAYGESKSGSTTVDLVVGAPANDTSSVSSDVTSATVGTATTLTATIKDSQNHPVEGESVTFNVTALDGTVGSSIVTKQTNSTGVAAATFTLSTTAGINTINVCTENGDVNQNISITGTPGNATQLNVTTDAASIISGASATITAALEDQYGNPTKLNATGVEASGSAAVNVTFEQDTTDHGTLVDLFALTTIVGDRAEASVTFTANATEGITTITGSATEYASDSAEIRTSAPDSISVGVSPASILADSDETATIAVQLLDEFGEAISVPGVLVTFVAVPSNVSITNYTTGAVATTAVTDATGMARVNVTSTSTTIETITITAIPDATTGLNTKTADVTITGVATKIVLSADPTTGVAANGTAASVITAQLQDDSGNNVAAQGTTVTFGTTGAGSLDSSTATTDANGVATVSLTSDTTGTTTVTAYLPFTSNTVSVEFTTEAALTVDTIEVTPAGPLTMNVTETETFTAVCKNGTTVLDIAVTWASSNTTVGTIDASGVFTADVNGTTTITATAQGVTSNAVTVSVGAEYDSADTNHDCVVDMPELMTQIGKWKSGEVGMPELMTSIGRWKLGTGGYC